MVSMRRLTALPHTEWTEDELESSEIPRASGTRPVARPVELPDVDAAPEGLERSERPTLRVPRFELFEGGAAERPERSSRDSGEMGDARNEAPTVPAPAVIASLAEATEDVPRQVPPSTTPPSLREIGSLQRVPRLIRSIAEIRQSKLDPKQAFVLVLVDGHLDIETILDASALPMHEVLRILVDLLRKELIALD